MPQPPKFQPRRRNARNGPLVLPGGGRQGVAPKWPLPGKPTKDEDTAWKQLWATPQAVAWENSGWTRTVARYCRAMVASESPLAQPALLGQVTALEDRLGLTPKAMRLLLWQVGAAEPGEEEAPSGTIDIRDRLRAVE